MKKKEFLGRLGTSWAVWWHPGGYLCRLGLFMDHLGGSLSIEVVLVQIRSLTSSSSVASSLLIIPNSTTTFSSFGNLSSMAGLIASLFKSPELCRLSGVSLQARSATEGPEFLYAALYFHTMTSLVSDDFRERWRITECSCHISLTQHEMMPRYDRRIIYDLRQEF